MNSVKKSGVHRNKRQKNKTIVLPVNECTKKAYYRKNQKRTREHNIRYIENKKKGYKSELRPGLVNQNP